MCNAHYHRLTRLGDVQADVPLQVHHRGRYGKCGVPGCGEVYRSKGLCAVHYMEKFGAALKDKPCAVLDCKRPLYRRGWCAAHYQRWSAYGDPLGGGPSRGIRGSVPREQQRWLQDEARRVAKAKLSQVTGETAEYVTIIRRDPCAYCGAPMKHVDHVIPFADGGPTDWTNLAPACAGCNHRKSRTALLVFLLAERGGEADGRAA